MFTLNSKLKEDCFFVVDLKLSSLLLMNDSNYIWFILVPKKDGLVELIDLDFDEQIELLKEINQISNILKNQFKVEKLNIATLGNVVNQLHIHVIGRFKRDISFPKPVWGAVDAKSYSQEKAQEIINLIKENMTNNQKDLVNKLLYRSLHRGCKETDFLLGKYSESFVFEMDLGELKLFEEFLEEDDMAIYDWILSKINAPEKYSKLLKKIRDFHKI